MEKSVQKNAAVGVTVLNWGFDNKKGGWLELEFTGSFQDENGQVIFREPSVKVVDFPIKTESATGMHPNRMRSDPRQRGPL